MSEIINPEKTVKVDNEEYNIIYRKYDSDDVIRIRSYSVNTTIVEGKEKLTADVGMLQKVSVCLGVKSCPWFSDMIDENYGVTPDIFNRRMGLEFRRIPTNAIDKVFKEVNNFNKTDFNINELKKK